MYVLIYSPRSDLTTIREENDPDLLKRLHKGWEVTNKGSKREMNKILEDLEKAFNNKLK